MPTIGARQIVMSLGKKRRMLLNDKKTFDDKEILPLRSDFLLRREAKASRHINIASHYDNDTLMDDSGKLIKIIRLSGLDFSTKSDAMLDMYKLRRNSLWKSFNSEFGVHCWTNRRKTVNFPSGEFQNPYAAQVNKKYKAQIEKTEMFHCEHFLAIYTKPPEGILQKGLDFFRQFSEVGDKAARESYTKKRHEELSHMMQKVLKALADYEPEVLATYKKNQISFSSPLEFLSDLINLQRFSIPFITPNAKTALLKNRLFFNRRSGTIEARMPDGKKRFASVLTIKEYAPVTRAGMFDVLNQLRIEYTMTQSYRFYDRQVAKNKLRDQQKDMEQSRDESVSQTEQIDEAFDEAASGEVSFGAHHFTLVCYADTQDMLNKNIGEIIGEFSNLDINCVREDVASECAFWAQLPGNIAYVPRKADISSLNFASLASFHNYAQGKLTGNHWGNAVTVFETLSGSPYYFNFHFKDVGNFLVYGAMGSGKTLLIGFLILQSMKFGGKRIIFDKDRGLEIMVRAMGGVYETIAPGIKTGMSPCQLEDTPENRKFLSYLFQKMLFPKTEDMKASDSEVIEHAIGGMFHLPRKDRQLKSIAPFFGIRQKDSIRARFDEWHSAGKHAWLFDHEKDSLHLNTDVIGIDLGKILKDEDCKTPTLMYLWHRFSQLVLGQRAIIFMDEAWRCLEDDYLANEINDLSRTPRKKNWMFGLASQEASDAKDSPVNAAAVCKFFFPNPMAKYETYVDKLGLSQQEYEIIKTMDNDAHYFLLNYGRGKESVVLRANLAGLEEEIAVISAREQSLNVFDTVRHEVGEKEEQWLPLFYERMREMST